MTPILEARGLRVSYGETPGLQGLDAAVPRGEIVALLGENGSGKSTFLKAIARILEPSSGEIRLDGRGLSGLPRRETARRIAYVPQSVDLVFPILSLDLVLQGRAPYGRGFAADSPEDRRLALEAMRACDVEPVAWRDASALSGGEKRRVFLARALAQQAEIWLLDEPTSGLDPRHRLEFLETLARVHRERATTVLFVTHEIDLAAHLADRIILLRAGRALAEGPPAEALTEATLREAFAIETRVEIDSTGRRRFVPVAPSDRPLPPLR
ncbi:MAG TPA: ABC transporter ATP-binding protein [Thermoanaerobaculia bacterium]